MPKIKMVGYSIISKLEAGTRRIAYLARDEKGQEVVLIQQDLKKLKLQYMSADSKEKDVAKREKKVDDVLIKEKNDFKADFERVKGLKHPHVVEVQNVVYDGENDNYVAITEYAHGENIFSASRGLTWLQRTALIAQVLDGAQFIHNNGMLHLNIKSRYVRVELTSLQAKLTDFGYAYEFKNGYDGKIRGSAHSIAPEIVFAKNKKVDQRADIYSTGVLWYYIMTGKFPFPERDKARLNQVLLPDIVKEEKKPMDVFYYDPAIPRECNDILMKMIEKEPEKRFASAEEARALLIERWPEIAEENLDQTLSMMKVVTAEPSINEDPDDEL